MLPDSSLSPAIAARLAPFKAYTVAHPLLAEVDRQLFQALLEPAGASFIFVIGPARVGKTTLKEHVEQRVHQVFQEPERLAPGRIPLLSLEAPAPETGNFHWKDYYVRALKALDEPLIREKRYGYRPDGVGHTIPTRIPGKATAPELRLALESALTHRRPAAIIIDEAQHFGKVASGRRLQDQLDCLKSLANLTNIVHVLLGPYDLLALRNLSAQLSGRSRTIHFRRYRLTSADDCTHFQKVLRSFQQQLPLEEGGDLITHWRLCYERSIGCIGVLKNWIVRAVSEALSAGAKRLEEAHLVQTAPSLSECEHMARDILVGEAELAESDTQRQALHRLLEWDQPALPPELITSPKGRGGRRPGERLPRRDPVAVPGTREGGA
jgi:hypothetical protein